MRLFRTGVVDRVSLLKIPTLESSRGRTMSVLAYADLMSAVCCLLCGSVSLSRFHCLRYHSGRPTPIPSGSKTAQPEYYDEYDA